MISKMDKLTIIPLQILTRVSLILIIFINTNFQHKEGSFDSVIGYSEFNHWRISKIFLSELKNPFLKEDSKSPLDRHA
jgi:hypothetical protein